MTGAGMELLQFGRARLGVAAGDLLGDCVVDAGNEGEHEAASDESTSNKSCILKLGISAAFKQTNASPCRDF